MVVTEQRELVRRSAGTADSTQASNTGDLGPGRFQCGGRPTGHAGVAQKLRNLLALNPFPEADRMHSASGPYDRVHAWIAEYGPCGGSQRGDIGHVPNHRDSGRQRARPCVWSFLPEGVEPWASQRRETRP